ncbi:hypothetical protein THII_0275 [Thioploca ingrica]|uniref:DUF3782 domain-containing protein n=1 Tax=Thioploca ingrica TaxID=40754 RepID=A0A090AH37_9GAMM|nr:hypothetical protein THII_0275 [Thioploca ingrica]
MTQLTIDSEQLDQLILQRLPTLVQQNAQIQGLVLDLARQNFADRKETDDRFYQLLGELRRDREEQTRKWEKYTAEQNRKWEEYTQEQNRKWDEQNRKWEDAKREFDRMHEAIMAVAKKYDRSITAIGAHWGIKSESSFRNALVGILEKSFGVQVLNINDYDDEGVVFGRPDQIELDVIIKNGLLIICEIKSSIDKAGMYSFERKVRFYEKKHQRPVTRMLVISPMVDAKACPVAKQLGIEVYSDSMEVKEL